MKQRVSFSLVSIILALALSMLAMKPQNRNDDGAWPSGLDEFTSMEPIDTHAHVTVSDPGFYAFLEKMHLHLIDIVVANKEVLRFPTLEPKIEATKNFVKGSRGHAVLCTTFDPFGFSNPNFAEGAVRQLNRDFAQGAVAVKIWKNVGMELKDKGGRFVLPDDPRLQPIYEDIAAQHRTLIAHLAEPDSCWQPPNPSSPDYHYYSQHPEWYMYEHPDHPRKETIIKARDHMLEQNPGLHVVGAHLGSLETDLDAIAQRLDRYSNFAVDVAARVSYLTLQPTDKARQFLIKYQDRILYGTDLSLYDPAQAGTASKSWEKRYATDWAFFSTGKTVEYQGRTVHGLNLPADVLRKLYHENAVRWIQGVVPQNQK